MHLKWKTLGAVDTVDWFTGWICPNRVVRWSSTHPLTSNISFNIFRRIWKQVPPGGLYDFKSPRWDLGINFICDRKIYRFVYRMDDLEVDFEAAQRAGLLNSAPNLNWILQTWWTLLNFFLFKSCRFLHVEITTCWLVSFRFRKMSGLGRRNYAASQSAPSVRLLNDTKRWACVVRDMKKVQTIEQIFNFFQFYWNSGTSPTGGTLGH